MPNDRPASSTTDMSMDGKIVLITGASSGIGLAAALLLAERGAEIAMVCRDSIRGNFMRNGVAEYANGRPPALFFADLSSQEEVHVLADQIRSRFAHIDVLINNAGAVFERRELTTDAVEKTLAVNYLAPFLLSNLLLDLVQAAPAGRIVNVASQAHSGSIDFANMQSELHYDFRSAYNRSKLCNILFTYELARRVAGSTVTVNCLCPGATLTRFGENLTGLPFFLTWLAKRNPLSWAYPETGARTSVYLASSPELVGITGQFFVRCREARTKPITYQNEIAMRLWNLSEALCGLVVSKELCRTES
jgi:NAD(P)-dependent dehydrogenase (short-subunit alcohol dehydrogenase family)